MNMQAQKPKTKFALGNYVEVSERISAWFEEFPEGRIETEIVSMTDSLVVTRSLVYRTQNPDEKAAGIGHSMLGIPGKTPYTKDSELENCETSSVGRALVMAGIPSKSIASGSEIRNKSYDQSQEQAYREPQPPAKQFANAHGLKTADAIETPLQAAQRTFNNAVTWEAALGAVQTLLAKLNGSAPNPAQQAILACGADRLADLVKTDGHAELVATLCAKLDAANKERILNRLPVASMA